jgi:hypothetical protein
MKRGPVHRLMTRLAAEQRAAGITGRPVRILNVLGLRAQEFTQPRCDAAHHPRPPRQQQDRPPRRYLAAHPPLAPRRSLVGAGVQSRSFGLAGSIVTM